MFAKPAHHFVQHILRITLPPVPRRKNLNLTGTDIARGLDRTANCLQVRNTIAHHAAVKQHVGRVLKPVAKMIPQHPSLSLFPQRRSKG